MTLQEIAKRLEAIEQELSQADLYRQCEECEEAIGVSNDADRIEQLVESVRLDIERHLLKTQGTLTT